MPYTPTGLLLALPHAHIEMFKRVLPLVIGEAVSATHRLEIFSRICGYGSWAALLATLKAAPDTPVLLRASETPADAFLRELPQPVRRHLAHLGRDQIVDLVIAGMDLSWSDDFGDIGFADTVDLSDLIHHQRYSGDRQMAFSVAPVGRRYLVISPETQVGLAPSANEVYHTDRFRFEGEARWLAIDLHPDRSGRFFLPHSADQVLHEGGDLRGAPQAPAMDLIAPRLFYSDAECEAFNARFPDAVSGPFQTLKADLDDLEAVDGEDTDPFWHGYYGTARMDVPEDGVFTPEIAVHWLVELANVKVGVDHEYKRIVGMSEAA